MVPSDAVERYDNSTSFRTHVADTGRVERRRMSDTKPDSIGGAPNVAAARSLPAAPRRPGGDRTGVRLHELAAARGVLRRDGTSPPRTAPQQLGRANG